MSHSKKITVPGLVKSVMLVNQFSGAEMAMGGGEEKGLDLYLQISFATSCGVNTPAPQMSGTSQTSLKEALKGQPVRNQETVVS